ncbi:MAG TPA: 4-(cytidine 5'-diphospho)-2-C-methyl-D-erythritol kinase [Bryobacteraceae bacterium]|jgi:4-diphosphocytidyl-2-C-methyl-D-erythritol kinase
MKRRATLRSLAKINLDLRVLHKNPDGFHDLRTVFQTISLADTIDIEFEKSKRTELSIDDANAIPDNLILRAAKAALETMGIAARVHFGLKKRIPMGGGLGGGSSNAATVLLALPVLAGRALPMETSMQIAASLGSDVPFFLLGGTALGIGRGTELYPLPSLAAEPLLIVSPGLHIATPEAYRALNRSLTFTGSSSSINGFQSYVRALSEGRSAGAASALGANDFEAAVSSQYPQLKTIVAKLWKLDAVGVRMTGSGSAVFAIFGSRTDRERARKVLEGDRVFQGFRLLAASFVSQPDYRRLWRRQLAGHIESRENQWPPRSRYDKR